MESYAPYTQRRQRKLVKKPIPEVISLENIIELGNNLNDIEARVLYYTLYLSAGRIGEVLRLRVKDIEYAQNDTGKEIIIFNLITEKNRGHPIRSVPACYSDPTDDKKYYYEKNMVELIKAFASDKLDGEYLFTIKPIKAWKIFTGVLNKTVRAKAANTGKPIDDFELNIYPHYIRHCRLTHLRVIYGADAITLMRIAGWTNTNPARTYLHLGIKDLAKMFN